MNPVVNSAKVFIKALNDGAEFSEETVLECFRKEAKYSSSNDIESMKKWAAYYWMKYQSIGKEELLNASNDDELLVGTLYKKFGKL
ncbi:hypothetical protein [Thalassotalea mangrovi]|uniref:Uncharacterized protein n=1 Tax=Thalassotalea mangrovi TaxID=2572245 RepID=A0A4V5NTY7_9GAMM|nr:hypothetical protein [Thalassotalea mangrovi]TKB43559.1 hypothetical protein E8M12_14790 [Thalassotalea mangrovi]